MLASPIAALWEHYGIPMGGAWVLWLNLAIAAGVVYGPRILATQSVRRSGDAQARSDARNTFRPDILGGVAQ